MERISTFFVCSAAERYEGQEGQGLEAVRESFLSFSDLRSGTRLVRNSQKDPMDKKTNLQYLDLEFSKLEKAEMITYLNRLLTSYQIYVHKTRTFHWNVIGQTSEIREAPADLTGFEMVKDIVSDLRILMNISTDSIEKAAELSDYGTEILLKNHIKKTAKQTL